MTETLISEEEIQETAQKSNITYINPDDTTYSQLEPLNADDIIEDNVPPLPMIVEPVLPAQEIMFVYAKAGVGKTMFMLNLAYAIANGGSFLKYKVSLPHRVLYVDGEMSYPQINERLVKIKEQQGPLHSRDYLKIFTPDKLKLKGWTDKSVPLPVPQIDDPIGQKFYIEQILKYDIDVVIFDNISMLSSFDENSSKEWKPIQTFLSQLKALGKTIIMVHHIGKGDTYRGTSKMLDNVNTAIKLEVVRQDRLEEEYNSELKIKVSYEKNRSFGGVNSMPFEATINQFGWSHQSLEMSIIDQVVECYNMKFSTKEICEEIKKSKSYVNKLILKAKKTGRIRD